MGMKSLSQTLALAVLLTACGNSENSQGKLTEAEAFKMGYDAVNRDADKMLEAHRQFQKMDRESETSAPRNEAEAVAADADAQFEREQRAKLNGTYDPEDF